MDRRRVERHLIGCPQCRQHQTALGQALEILRTAAGTAPAESDAPSLWPALARQIRESRRPRPKPALAFSAPLSPLISWLRLNPRPAFGLGLALLAAAAVAVSPGARQRNATTKAKVVDITRPIAPARPLPATVQTPMPVPDSRRELPPTPEPAAAEARHDYDGLELGHPVPPDRGEVRDTRLTY
jgi:hypothetical protein